MLVVAVRRSTVNSITMSFPHIIFNNYLVDILPIIPYFLYIFTYITIIFQDKVRYNF